MAFELWQHSWEVGPFFKKTISISPSLKYSFSTTLSFWFYCYSNHSSFSFLPCYSCGRLKFNLNLSSHHWIHSKSFVKCCFNFKTRSTLWIFTTVSAMWIQFERRQVSRRAISGFFMCQNWIANCRQNRFAETCRRFHWRVPLAVPVSPCSFGNP